MSLSNEIKILRQRMYLTQNEFAQALNVSFATVNRWETGKARPNISTMKEIRKFCESKNIDYSAVEDAWIKAGLKESFATGGNGNG